MAKADENHWDAWVAICGCSAVVLGAHEKIPGVKDDRTTESKWVLAGTIITITLSFFATIASRVAVEKFVGGLVEKATALICLGVWCGLLAVIMNPTFNLAQGATSLEFRSVINANLYFFSWGAFIACLYVVAKMSQADTHLSRFSETPKKMIHWWFVTASSVVVMWSAAVYFEDLDSDVDCSNATGDIEETCWRTAYGTFLGAFGTICGLVALFFSKCNCWPKIVEVILAFVLACLYILGVAVLTFQTGPATLINNLYFASWIGTIWSVFLTLSAWHDFRDRGSGEEEEEEVREVKEEDVKEEAEAEPEKAAEAEVPAEEQEATA